MLTDMLQWDDGYQLSSPLCFKIPPPPPSRPRYPGTAPAPPLLMLRHSSPPPSSYRNHPAAARYLVRSSPPSRYYNHPAAARYLVRSSPDYCGGILTLNNDRSYLSFQYLEQALAFGRRPEEAGARIPSIHDVLGGSSELSAAASTAKVGSPVTSAGIAASGTVSEHFSVAMMGASLGNFRSLAQAFDFGSVHSIGDMGGSNGCLSACLCQVMLWPAPPTKLQSSVHNVQDYAFYCGGNPCVFSTCLDLHLEFQPQPSPLTTPPPA